MFESLKCKYYYLYASDQQFEMLFLINGIPKELRL